MSFILDELLYLMRSYKAKIHALLTSDRVVNGICRRQNETNCFQHRVMSSPCFWCWDTETCNWKCSPNRTNSSKNAIIYMEHIKRICRHLSMCTRKQPPDMFEKSQTNSTFSVYFCFALSSSLTSVYFSLSSYHGYLDPMFLESINTHWMRFNPPKPWEHITLAMMLLCIMVVGMVGNALVVYMFLR